MIRAAGAAVFAAMLATGPVAAQVPACPGADKGFSRAVSPDAEIAYRWQPEKLRVGQFFEIEVIACRAPGTSPVGRIEVDALMPAHNHGMNYRPAAAPVGPGHFRFTGLMFHMPGTWRLTFELIQGDTRTQLAKDIELGP
jgi:hypothetical protein